jgi:hypothetical protein
VAALANMEMLPWDVWGAMLGWEEPIDDERLALFEFGSPFASPGVLTRHRTPFLTSTNVL